MTTAEIAQEKTYGPDGVYVVRERTPGFWGRLRGSSFSVVVHLNGASDRYDDLPKLRADQLAAHARREVDAGRMPNLEALYFDVIANAAW